MIDGIHGVVVVDKPVGPTSFDIVRQARRATGARKVGHGGTLDPLASGVLPLCFGEATKLAQFLLDADKEYEATISFGAETDTYDAAGAVTLRRPADHLDPSAVRGALAGFVGEQAQIPPMYSALKREGRPLYAYARAGETVDRPARQIFIHALELRAFVEAPAADESAAIPADLAGVSGDGGGRGPLARVFIRCSKGTYVRSLAYDLGRALGTCAHLTALRRTRSGPFGLQGALRPESFGITPLPIVSPADALAHLTTVVVPEPIARAIIQGQAVTWEQAGFQFPTVKGVPDSRDGREGDEGSILVRILTPDGDLLAVAPRLGGATDRIATLRVFQTFAVGRPPLRKPPEP